MPMPKTLLVDDAESIRASISRVLATAHDTNLLLDTLPSAYRASLIARMETVPLPLSTALDEPEKTPEYVHFPTTGVVSLVTCMSDGKRAEVGMIGREGLVECLQLLGPAQVSTNAFVLVEGSTLRMPFAAFKREFDHHAPLRYMVFQFVQSQSLMVTQLAACNRLHGIEQRLARGLLMVQDRVQRDVLYLTHESIAQMLGANRITVTLAANGLQRSGVIECRRGRLKILDRERLEDAACECYSIMHRRLRSLCE